ncbi:hypothetical protein B0H14DRAFT_3655717 [Mycena olivaceomarginata]|nr:hypothetical protein B0H14DRAFT_3655717 [Mycena olivaceomarginata]
MSHNYTLRYQPNEVEDAGMQTEDDASSSIGPYSSPYIPAVDLGAPAAVPFHDLDPTILPSDDEGDLTYASLPPPPIARRSNDEKALEILATVFTSEDPGIKTSAGVFYRDSGPTMIMQHWFSREGLRDLDCNINQWIMMTAAAIGAKEFSRLIDRAARGPHAEAAKILRVRAEDANVKLVQDFRLRNLTNIYDHTLSNVQLFLKALIGKENKTAAEGSRNVDDGRTLITSIALNLRSRRLNLHQVVNSFIFWDNKMPKRLVQAMNHLGVCTSSQFRTDAVTFVSKDSVAIARAVSADPMKLKMLVTFVSKDSVAIARATAYQLSVRSGPAPARMIWQYQQRYQLIGFAEYQADT